MNKRGCINYGFGIAALVGICLLIGSVYLHQTLGKYSDSIPPTGTIQVSDSVGMPTWPALPNSTDPPTPTPYPTNSVPPDPGRGPIPVCWIRPTSGPCPPKP